MVYDVNDNCSFVLNDTVDVIVDSGLVKLVGNVVCFVVAADAARLNHTQWEPPNLDLFVLFVCSNMLYSADMMIPYQNDMVDMRFAHKW